MAVPLVPMAPVAALLPATMPASEMARDVERICTRMQALGLNQTQLGQLLGLPQPTIAALLAGRYKRNGRLGHDRWTRTVLTVLDRYEQALTVQQRYAKAAAAELKSAGLPCPFPLLACMPHAPTPRLRYGGRGGERAPRKRSPRRATTAQATQAEAQEARTADERVEVSA